MITSKIILSEVQKFQDIYTKYIIINEYFEVVVIIGKLSLSYKEFKNSISHKRKEIG